MQETQMRLRLAAQDLEGLHTMKMKKRMKMMAIQVVRVKREGKEGGELDVKELSLEFKLALVVSQALERRVQLMLGGQEGLNLTPMPIPAQLVLI